MYDLKKLSDGECINMTTSGEVSVPIMLDILSDMAHRKPDEPKPSKADLMLFGSMVLEHRLNPYQQECWLVRMKGRYTPIVAAQVRMRKCMSQPDYEGYEWGWIAKDGTRHEQGGSVPIPEVVGGWAKVYRKDRKPYYHECTYAEYGGKGITMFLKALKDQAHRYSYADMMGNLCTESELEAYSGRAFVESTPKSTVIMEQEDGVPTARPTGEPVQEPQKEPGESSGLHGGSERGGDSVPDGGMDQGGQEGQVYEPETDGTPAEPNERADEPDPATAESGTLNAIEEGFGSDEQRTGVEASGTGVRPVPDPVGDLVCPECECDYLSSEAPPRRSGKRQCPKCLRIIETVENTAN